MSITIEPFDPRHQDSVVALSLRAWAPVFDSLRQVFGEELYREFYPDEWRASQQKAVEDVCDSPDMKTWLAIDDETVAGFVALRFHAADRMGEIYMVAVDPEFQGRRIGVALTDFAVQHMKEVGMSIAMVETGSDPGHSPARRLYESAGFRLFPVSRYFKKL